MVRPRDASIDHEQPVHRALARGRPVPEEGGVQPARAGRGAAGVGGQHALAAAQRGGRVGRGEGEQQGAASAH